MYFSVQKYPRGYRLLVHTIFFLFISGLIGSCKNTRTNSSNDTERADSILEKTNDYLNSNQLDLSLRYLDSSFQAFKEAGPLDKWKRYRALEHFYLNYQVMPLKADLYVDSMYLVLAGLEDEYRYEYAHNIFARGDVLRAKKHYNEAAYKYYEGRQYALKYLDSCKLGGFTNRIGLIRYSQQEFSKAISHFKQALIEYAACDTSSNFEDSFLMPQSIYNNIALSYHQRNMPDSAGYYYQQGLEFIEKRQAKYPQRKDFIEMAIGVYTGNLGGLYAREKKYAEAEKYLKRSIEINDREGFAIEDAATAKNKLAVMYIEIDRLEDALQLIGELDMHLIKREGDNHEKHFLQRNILKLKSEYHKKKGEYRQALTYLGQFDKLRDSVAKVESEMRRTDLDATFKEAEQAYQLELSQKNSEIKTFYLASAIVIALLTVFGLVMVWLNLKRTRVHVQQLKLLNKQVTTQNSQLSDTLRILEQSQNENVRMTRVVAHDLRNPIGAVHMITSLMIHKKNTDPDSVELLEMMKRSATDCLTLLDELLQPKEMSLDLVKRPEDIYQLLRFCVDQLVNKATQKQQRIELEGSQVFAPVSAEKLWRVVSNLIGNAVKFSAPGKTIWVILKRSETHVRISIKDEGIGIPAELSDKIFQQPELAKRKGTEGEETFGLGLAICRQIVLAHSGNIWFESEAEKGTTFHVELPLD